MDILPYGQFADSPMAELLQLPTPPSTRKHLKKNPLYHSFHIIVIPSVLLSFLPDYCHSFLFIVNCHSFRISVIPSELLSFLPNYCHFKYLSSWIAPAPSHIMRVVLMFPTGLDWTGPVFVPEFLINYTE
jgi:hypothetical protein